MSDGYDEAAERLRESMAKLEADSPAVTVERPKAKLPKQFREQIGDLVTADDVRELLERSRTATRGVTVRCDRHSPPRSFVHQVPDDKAFLEALKWATEQGYGKVPSAKPLEEVDFSKRDPFEMVADERGQLLEKVLAALEGKASPPTQRGTLASF